jgi:hypothetical protein
LLCDALTFALAQRVEVDAKVARIMLRTLVAASSAKTAGMACPVLYQVVRLRDSTLCSDSNRNAADPASRQSGNFEFGQSQESLVALPGFEPALHLGRHGMRRSLIILTRAQNTH